MSKRLFTILLIGLLLAITVTACGAKPTPTPEASSVTETQLNPISVTLVTDIGGIEEQFYSAQAWKGIQAAKNLFTIEARYEESKTAADFANLLEKSAAQGADLTIGTGKAMSQALESVAKAHSDANFAIVDAKSVAPNVRGITFDVAAPSYLSGYLAGSLTQTGVVCLYGEADDEAITEYMTGFFNGADYYRRQNGANIDILGWDPYNKEGVFLKDKTSQEEAYQVAKDFFSQNCDILFAAAQDAAQGSAKAAQEENKLFIGATVDWYVVFPEYGNVALTSIVKNTDKAVSDTVVAYSAGSFQGGENYVGTLENNGVGLAPYHQLADNVSTRIQDELNQVQNNILTGHLDPAVPWVFGENNQPAPESE